MDYSDVLKIRSTQQSQQDRYDIQTKLAEENIEKLLATKTAQQIAVPRISEIEATLFKLRSELLQYINETGLIDGLIWDGQLQPVSDRKIKITEEMIKAVTDSIYTKELVKLAGIEEGAEVNKIIDLIFNDVTCLDDGTRVATITKEMIKEAYELNTDTNAYTDHEKELVATIPDITDKNTEQDGRLDSIEVHNTTQDERLTAIEAKDVEQDGRLDAIEKVNEDQELHLATIDSKDAEQDETIKTIQAKDSEQDIRLDKKDVEVKAIETSVEHLCHEVDAKIKDVILDGRSVADSNRNAILDSSVICKVHDVQVDNVTVVNNKTANILLTQALNENLAKCDEKIKTALANVSQIQFIIVDTLPASGEDGKIYCLRNADNQLEQYIYINGAWEQLGASFDAVEITEAQIKAWWGEVPTTPVYYFFMAGENLILSSGQEKYITTLLTNIPTSDLQLTYTNPDDSYIEITADGQWGYVFVSKENDVTVTHLLNNEVITTIHLDTSWSTSEKSPSVSYVYPKQV